MAATPLQISVLIGTTALPDTPANQQKIFIFSASKFKGGITGNVPYTVPGISPYRFDLNNPSVPNAISVSSFHLVNFSSLDFFNDPYLADQVSTCIDKGLVKVTTAADQSTPLTRANINAFVASA